MKDLIPLHTTIDTIVGRHALKKRLKGLYGDELSVEIVVGQGPKFTQN